MSWAVGRYSSSTACSLLLTDDAELCILLLAAGLPGDSAVATAACRITVPPRLATKVASVAAASAAGPAAANDLTAVVLALANNPNIMLCCESET